MRAVHIVGTSHVFQRPPITRREEAFQLQSFLLKLCSRHAIAAIGEELSIENLADRELDRSTCAEVAFTLGIGHRYCNPPLDVQRALGIPIGEEGYRAREAYWLEQLVNWGRWPCVFVCGTNHVAPFKRLSSEGGLIPTVVRKDWAPDYALVSEATRIRVLGPN